MGFHPALDNHLHLPLAAIEAEGVWHLKGAMTAWIQLLQNSNTLMLDSGFFRKSLLLCFWLFCCHLRSTSLQLEVLMTDFLSQIAQCSLVSETCFLMAFLSYDKKPTNPSINFCLSLY